MLLLLRFFYFLTELLFYVMIYMIVQTTNLDRIPHRRHSLNLAEHLQDSHTVTSAEQNENDMSKVCSRS